MIRVYSSHIHIQFLQDGFSHGKNYFLKLCSTVTWCISLVQIYFLKLNFFHPFTMLFFPKTRSNPRSDPDHDIFVYESVIRQNHLDQKRIVIRNTRNFSGKRTLSLTVPDLLYGGSGSGSFHLGDSVLSNGWIPCSKVLGVQGS